MIGAQKLSRIFVIGSVVYLYRIRYVRCQKDSLLTVYQEKNTIHLFLEGNGKNLNPPQRVCVRSPLLPVGCASILTLYSRPASSLSSLPFLIFGACSMCVCNKAPVHEFMEKGVLEKKHTRKKPPRLF